MSDVWGELIKNSSITQPDLGASEPNFLFVGSERSGKTTLQNIFFNKADDQPHPTLALSYQSCTVKVSGHSHTLHFWELGGGLQLDRILDTIISESSKPNFLIFICINLTNSSSILDGLSWADLITSRFGNNRRSVFFACTHYDLFDLRDPNEKEIINNGIRSIASQQNFGIIYTSNKQSELCTRFKDIIKFIGIAKSKLRQKSFDSPLLISPGEDKESIDNRDAISALMKLLSQETEGSKEVSPRGMNIAENPQFAEEEIDALRTNGKEKRNKTKMKNKN
ncbi:cytoplasmic dynein 2 light intermediate chain 1 [Histomonas meleagridis]|uniref:cytoplasmic dynein 2 light intermediate chain 1 n=1 Tax=Histomonas meleagridis TaxID=135588 RepID=UPI00355A5B3E|nr:cytoplasmic dynein 2 light intermediate chain 1 [Histomonas meleagridis]KAH0807070.1 cytoplasmic dynein 2 light intermediate chain 1 [Histomonas meleagridis]